VASLRLVTDPRHEPRTAPKFNRMIVEKLFGLFDGFAVIAADDGPVVRKMFVTPDEVRPVFCHPKSHCRIATQIG
jgi:hypothetical protein